MKGAKGAKGLTGPLGRRGKIGKPGQKGPLGVKGQRRKNPEIEAVLEHFDDVYLQLEVLLKRVAQIQGQVDRLTAQVAQQRRGRQP